MVLKKSAEHTSHIPQGEACFAVHRSDARHPGFPCMQPVWLPRSPDIADTCSLSWKQRPKRLGTEGRNKLVDYYDSAIEGIEDVIATGDAGIREYLRLAKGAAVTAAQWREYFERSGNRMLDGLDEWILRMVREPLRLSKRGEPISNDAADNPAVHLYEQTYRRVYRQSEYLRVMRKAWLNDEATHRIETADAIRFLTWQVRDAHDELDYLAKDIDYTDIQRIKQAVTGKTVRRRAEEKSEAKPRKPRKYFTDNDFNSIADRKSVV